ncbi:MAG: flippase [Anaerolineaceae bacterium]|nr:flippase [Anaerolineaceae bacterium]
MNEIERKDLSTLAKGAGFALIGKITGRGLHVIGQIALARILGPAGLGIYSLGWNTLRIISLFAPMGLDKGVIRFASHQFTNRKEDGDLHKLVLQSLFMSLASSICIAVILFGFAPVLENLFRKQGLTQIFRLISFAVPFATLLVVGASATSISQDVKYSILSEEIAQPSINLVLILLFYWLGMGIGGAVLAASVSFFLSAGLAIYFLRRLIPGMFAWEAKIRLFNINSKLLTYSLPIALSGAFSTLILLLDRVMIGYFRTDFETGIYQAISLYSLIFVTILSALKTIFSPMISELFNNTALARFHSLYKLTTKWGIYFGIPFLLILLFSPDEVIRILYGEIYTVGTSALTILMLGQIANIGTGPVDLMLMMTDHQKDWLWITGAGFFINIVLNVLLIPSFGYTGAATSVSITLSIIYIAGLIRVKQVHGIWPYAWQYLKGLLITLFTIIVLVVFNRILQVDSALLHVLIISVLSFGVFIAGLLIIGLDEADRELLFVLQKKFVNSFTKYR